MTDTISFETTKVEAQTISRITRRYCESKPDADFLQVNMDLTACHCNGCELDLAKLEASDDADFFHDVNGIRRYIDRESGTLTNCFDPRCSA